MEVLQRFLTFKQVFKNKHKSFKCYWIILMKYFAHKIEIWNVFNNNSSGKRVNDKKWVELR